MVLDAHISRFAAALMGWAPGARLGNDSVWLKPPGQGSEVAYHRDRWYVPTECATAWVTLTDVNEQNGTLEYVPGSHRWPPEPPFGRDEFHVGEGRYRDSALKLAAKAGVAPEALAFEKVTAPAGSIVFHHGDLLHGSDKNKRLDAWRKSMGIHLINAESHHGERDGYM